MAHLPLTHKAEGEIGSVEGKDCHRSEQRRIELLLEWGHTYEEIMQAELTKLKYQLLRQRTLGKLKSVQMDDISLLFEGVRMKYAVRKARTNQSREVVSRMA
mmetsp:Transcript_22032/g.32426  ORF Transcript_22032/g.32426 Transcript_22032/m.32426 type:complete len:102 (+) Transcript_22032:368-673(+)